MTEDSCPYRNESLGGWGLLELRPVAKNFATHKNRCILAFSRCIFSKTSIALMR